MKLRPFAFLTLLGVIVLTGYSCSKNDQFLIPMEQYIEENNIVLTKQTNRGIGVVIDVEGSSAKPSQNSSVTVNYTGYLTNGDQFESRNDVTFSLTQVIAGWTEGIPEFGRGGKGTLYIPYELAYGTAGRGSIPPRADLIFEIELLDF